MNKYISLAIIFAIFFLISFEGASAKIHILRRNQRTVTPEDVAFQLIYLGSCSKFFSIPSIIISKKTPDNCLPLRNTAPFSTLDELSAHVICTDIGPNRAQIDFVEIFEPATPDVPFPDFIISFATNAPYKANVAGVSYFRLPSCEIDEDFCSTTDYVKSCSENLVQFTNGFVVSKDVVYIVPGGTQYVGCSTTADSCCSYVVPGFCPRSSDNSIFRVKYKSQNNERPHHERPHHERPHHERPHDDDDNRREGQHNEHQEQNENKKQESQENNTKQVEQKQEEDKPSTNNSHGRGKHPVKSQEQKKEKSQKPEKILPLLPLRELAPQNDENQEEDNKPFFVFDLKKKMSTNPAPTPAKKAAEPKKVEVVKPLIPLREIHNNAQSSKKQMMDEEDDDEYKRK